MDVKKAILFVNLQKKNSSVLARQIEQELTKKNIQVTIFSFEGNPEELLLEKWDIAFSLGGDGTILYAARTLAGTGTPIMPVNLGTLGFIASVKKDKWLDVFELWRRGEVNFSPRCMLDVSVEREAETVNKNTCLNDAVISTAGIAKLIKLKVHICIAPGKYSELGFYRCDGLIVATPTGSTGYSLSAGGPILDPEMEAMILNPICPFTLFNRPLVFPSSMALTVTVAEDQRSGVLLTIDGQDTFTLECKDRIIIQQAPSHAKLISVDRNTYYSALRSKLSWFGDVVSGSNGDAHA